MSARPLENNNNNKQTKTTTLFRRTFSLTYTIDISHNLVWRANFATFDRPKLQTWDDRSNHEEENKISSLRLLGARESPLSGRPSFEHLRTCSRASAAADRGNLFPLGQTLRLFASDQNHAGHTIERVRAILLIARLAMLLRETREPRGWAKQVSTLLRPNPLTGLRCPLPSSGFGRISAGRSLD